MHVKTTKMSTPMAMPAFAPGRNCDLSWLAAGDVFAEIADE